MSIEESLRQQRYHRIGWAIMHMNYWQRLWWALTGCGQYMQTSYWENTTQIEVQPSEGK
jgi:hypothetical protein